MQALYRAPNALKAPPNGTLPDQRILPWSYLRFSPDGKQLAAWLSSVTGPRSSGRMSPDGTGAQRQLERCRVAAGREFSWLRDSRRMLFADRSGSRAGPISGSATFARAFWSL